MKTSVFPLQIRKHWELSLSEPLTEELQQTSRFLCSMVMQATSATECQLLSILVKVWVVIALCSSIEVMAHLPGRPMKKD